mgnify:FL=1
MDLSPWTRRYARLMTVRYNLHSSHTKTELATTDLPSRDRGDTQPNLQRQVIAMCLCHRHG